LTRLAVAYRFRGCCALLRNAACIARPWISGILGILPVLGIMWWDTELMSLADEIGPQYHPILLQLAREAIAYGLDRGCEMNVQERRYPEPLREQRASFVTLKLEGELRGCIGSFEAYRSLVKDIAGNAYAAAFSDPRFKPLTRDQFPRLQIDISILSPSEELRFDSETDLLRQVRPGLDGLTLQEGRRRSTFLPNVWESLPDKRQFLEHLKLKAGLDPDYWSDSIRAFRYTTQRFGQG
jgi:AmmeMemoRadiSam system protein A